MSARVYTPSSPPRADASALPVLTQLSVGACGGAGGAGHYVASRGYYATPSVYDVVVTSKGVEVAVVGFSEKQTTGAVFWQGGYETQLAHQDNEAKIQSIARVYARRNTGWAFL